jgi:hypothetical protein
MSHPNPECKDKALELDEVVEIITKDCRSMVNKDTTMQSKKWKMQTILDEVPSQSSSQ